MRGFISLSGVALLLLAGCGGDKQVTRGVLIYGQNCAICHGGDGRGGGGANVAGLSKTPIDLTILSAENNGTFPADRVLRALSGYAEGSHAGRRMTPFAGLSSDTRRRVRTPQGTRRVPAPQSDLIAYLQSIQR